MKVTSCVNVRFDFDFIVSSKIQAKRPLIVNNSTSTPVFRQQHLFISSVGRDTSIETLSIDCARFYNFCITVDVRGDLPKMRLTTSSPALKALTVSLAVGSVDAFWRMPCRSRSGLARIDPLVSFGTISEHAHAIHGSSGTFTPRATSRE